MTTRYRVEYALKTHRRDQFIEWIKGLLAVPFVLYSQPTGVFDTRATSIAHMAEESHRRYAEIFRDVEHMIDDHITRQDEANNLPSKLKMLVPSAGPFFTRLPLEAAFNHMDTRRLISSRRYVSPSFNDVRLILNAAQIMAVTAAPDSPLQLATFDGDVTLYDDGESLEPSSPLIPRLLDLLRKDIKIGIVTAAGYTTADRYYARLHGLLDAIAASTDLTPTQKESIVIMGGEANYLFEYAPQSPHLLSPVPLEQWLTPEMAAWSESDITALLDVAEAALLDCVKTLNLPATLLRKDRAVGIIPTDPSIRIPRESLEETVLVVQKILELSALGSAARAPGGGDSPTTAGPRPRVPFCAFNGGRDVFVDIGDKSWGVTVCQRWFAAKAGRAEQPIAGENTLHIGDQFLSAGSNDFKARSVGTTAWIASPAETTELLDDLIARV
ncbi:IMP-specific 5'-nucleotidase 1 [Colletotrichum higginsianum IMI 349063]|uniref:IMP-specific 5'-nucleotidase 1 n=4 Tax=Colletotrichum destructivum species complex TaxID=2707350 RepID=A0A1B7Y1E8_COLHI|nr:IMP-specific 5'-nucleotidase 1 [Colletotrichum higginsianum IMI 349063]OBR05836.1 IMP-specific 5'-nucleotidase 1 [Colletotrichum higginsianum IMI 349063]TIC90607.1 IMP-specific 5'-nucleotidase 1 [Colletotrichum higginsianum]